MPHPSPHAEPIPREQAKTEAEQAKTEAERRLAEALALVDQLKRSRES